MRLLLINFVMNEDHPALSWQAKMAARLAQKVDKLVVLTEEVGRYHHAPNMVVACMPRRPWFVPKRLGSGWFVNFQLHALLKKHRCDVCFIHMAHRWGYRLFPALKWHQLPLLLWYAHGSVSWHLKAALACVDRVVTSTPEGFRLPSPKVHIIGQGIDTALFTVPETLAVQPEIVFVGRISERKRVRDVIAAFAALRALQPETAWHLKLVGPCLTPEDKAYKQALEAEVAAQSLTPFVQFTGGLEQAETANLYHTAALHLNLSETGSMDKTVMEALACGCPVLTSNIAFRGALAAHPLMLTQDITPTHLAMRMAEITANPPPRLTLRTLVEGQHDQAAWVQKIIQHLENLHPSASAIE